MWNGSQRYWSTGLWNGHTFSQLPEMNKGYIFNYSFVKNNERRYFSYTTYNHSILTRTVIDMSGQIKQWTWLNDVQEWILFWSQPTAQCDVYSLCGAFSLCDQKSMPFCRCLPGFQPASQRDWDLDNWSSGCIRKAQLQCAKHSYKGETDSFLLMPDIQLPVNSQPLEARSTKECELACLEKCNCSAYAYADRCLIWNGDVRNLQQSYGDDSRTGTLYLRLAASELPSFNRNKKREVVATITAVVGVVTILCIILGITWRRRRLNGTTGAVEGYLISFTYADLRRATKNFCDILGKGGFGSVFRGTLSDSTAVAVKKLEGLRQGEKQFRTEVSTLGTIQHVNLVFLRGFCSEGVKRLLVYDYMPNGSLDYHLFRNDSKILDWKTRYHIILGVARGLSYLHERCRECIIHCDIKPENILLDADFVPKVSDFGMAKLVGRDFSRVLTTMRGTVGYLAPEWILGLPITPKADVYSFGMMVFEIISGRRNIEPSEDSGTVFFLAWAATRATEGEVLSLLDKKLECDADMEELSRACKVAFWCIQDFEDHRPSMGQVIQVMEGNLEVNNPPTPKYILNLIKDQDPLSYCI